MRFTRPRELLIAGGIGLVLAYLGFQAAYQSIPRLPTLAGVTLLVLAIVEAVLGYTLRSRIRAGRVVGAIAVARSAMLAKASSLLGALMLGVWVGALAFLLPRSEQLAAASDDLPSAVVGVLCAAVLIGAALWLEHCCRNPEPRDPGRPTDSTG